MLEKISCTEQEEEIFELIRRHARRLNNVTPRVAGGWVRDKVMGNPSFDMDIALDNISGYEFAIGLQDSITVQKLTNVHVIKNNPEKSKHLETAVIRINGLFVDFVGLRSETYSNTRIPDVKPGTPREDALRRDLTINSLFYNIFTKEIEDYTRRGLRDINGMILMTPLDPKITLFDDPLRLVRVFRFHSKLGFSIDNRIYEALKDTKIREALVEKVSNERIYAEIFKIIHYPRGQYGLLEIIKRDYVDPIFKPPTRKKTSYEEGVTFCETVEKISNIWGRAYKREILNLYTVLCFFSRSTVSSPKGPLFTNASMMKTSLPAPRAFVKTIWKIEQSLVLLDGLNLKELELKELIRTVRRMGSTWYETLIIYSAIEHMKGRNEKHQDALKLIYEILQRGIADCGLAKPIINTGDLVNVLEISRTDLQFYIEESVVYQVFSGITEPDRIIEYLKRFKETLAKKTE